ncbi:MAG TPA: efflux RND transporter permease subunit [Gammaproteobacteria bacterium]|nr:efflux RND transporter permease subunit [Gammaproteobacteria bacterium]
MNLVQAALRRPVTVLVIVIAVVLGTALAIERMPRDIFPTLGIPTIYVAQPYGGMDPAQMEGYLTYYYEYHFLYITGLEHVESKSIQGAAIMKLQFYPGTDMNQAMAETVGYVNRARAFMPPGTVPPFITRFDAGSVPVGNLVFTSETRTVAQMQDAALNLVRPLFSTLPGVSAPPPFGGSARTILVNVDPERMRSFNMSPDEIVTAITRANLISPSGNMAVSGKYPMVPLNSVVKNIKDLESVPIRPGAYPTVFVRDVGTVTDGSDIVTSYALIDGRRTVYIPVTKRADASTLSVVALVKENLPKFQSVVPEGVKVSYEFDQAPFVIRAIEGLTFEGALGAVLTGIMVLLFLGDWRSAAIVVINIPLALMGALLALWLTGQTVNIMTLGGLALAIGVLVDMSTVVIENIHTHVGTGKKVARAVVDSGREVALPLLIAMLCILAVFVPSFFMVGAARAMFLPLSLAVGFAMVGSFLLSSTLVPILSVWLLRGHAAPNPTSLAAAPAADRFARLRGSYARTLERAVRLRWLMVAGYAVVSALAIGLVGARLGTEIFPKVDTGQIQVRLRAPTGTRVDGTEQAALQALDIIKNEVGPENVRITLAFLGVHAPNYPINLIYLWNGGSEEGVLQVQLNEGTGISTEALKERLRKTFADKMPNVSFSFEPSDIVSQVMSLGSSTPIEVAVSGPSLAANREFATRVRDRLMQISALRDVRFGQALDYPTLDVNVSRESAGLMGVDMTEVSRSLVSATSSSRFVVPNYWADPNSGVAYQIQVQIPQTAMSSVEDLENLPVAYNGGQPVLLRSLASVTPGTTPGQYERYNMQRMITVTANLAGDLGTVAAQVRAALAELGAPPARASVALRGQVVPMEQMLDGLQTGLLLAVAVIFLLLAANFQSLKLALVVVSTAPAAIAGVAVALALTGTTLNIQSYMGAIMSIGVAVANAILLVTFAERSRLAGGSAASAAVDGAQSRLRPILMTSLAMLAGMLPLAIGFGEGGEQTAPLGRAVVGGLAAATLATLWVLPAVFAIVQSRAHRNSASLDPDDASSRER